MTAEPTKLTVFFDFLCPFAYRTSQWLGQVQEHYGERLAIDWRFFSLEQINAPADSDWQIWAQEEDYQPLRGGKPENRALLAFWAAAAARRQGLAPFERFRRALYDARHQDRLDFSRRTAISAVAARVGLDVDRFEADFADRALLDALRSDHEAAVGTYRAFGVPTICYDAENAVYLKLGQVPPPDDAVALFDELRTSITSRRWLAEIKRPNP